MPSVPLKHIWPLSIGNVLLAFPSTGSGVLHVDRPGRNSLVYDLMEPNRPLVDRMVLDLFDKTIFTRGMFVPQDSGEIRMARQFSRYVAASCAVLTDTVVSTVSRIANMYRRG